MRERSRVRERSRARERNRVERESARETESRVRAREGRKRLRERVLESELGRTERYHRRSSSRRQAEGQPRPSFTGQSSHDAGYNHHNRVDVRWSLEQEEVHDSAKEEVHHGVWHELKHRRKRRLVESRDRVDRSSLKRQDRKVTRRNKQDVTTFDFSRFPEGVKENDLWKIFQKWGKVWKVFIPKYKNKEGHRFGFVRFTEVQDERRLETQLDTNIYIGGKKLFVNRPRYDRGRVIRENKNSTSAQRVVHNQKTYKENQEDAKLICPEVRKRSYVEVVREEMEGEESSYRKKEPPKRTTRSTQRTVVLSSHMETNDWLQKAWVGRLKNRGMFERVEEELKWVLDGEVNPCYWVDDWIFLPYLDDSKAARLIHEEKQSGSTPITELQKWSLQIRPDHRLTWVLLWGLLSTVWAPKHMEKVLKDIGELVEVDGYVEDRKRMDVAHILIRTNRRPRLQESVVATIDGVEYDLDVIEDVPGMRA